MPVEGITCSNCGQTYIKGQRECPHCGTRTKRNKYNAKRITVDGIGFDSQAEADYFSELRILERAGEIRGLRAHPVYVLQGKFKDGSATVAAITYEADAEYTEVKTGQRVAADVKGGTVTQTEAWKLKEKLFRFRYPEVDLRIIER